MPRFTAVALALLLPAVPSLPAADRPVTGAATVHWEPVDRAVQDFMDTAGCQAATVAVSRDGRLVLSRGYGWQDRDKKTPVPPDALFRLASVTKPFTMALVRNAVRAGHLSLDTRVFDLVDIRPPNGKVADPRVLEITVGQLLDHKGGWDLKKSLDPMFRHHDAEKALGLTNPPLPL
jgi:N-acyl-D-amino-acid deacylase